MPWIKVSSDVHKAMKEYLLAIEEMNLGELVEATFDFAMANLPEFEEFAEIEAEEVEEEQSEEETGEEDIEEEED
jgi:TusA-related sulfurtransferase